MPRCAAWLRLLVTALLCVVGVARPLTQVSAAAAATRASDPAQVSTSARLGELSLLRKRVANDSSTHEAGLVGARPSLVVAAPRPVGVVASRDARASSTSVERPRARGPPIA
ncbi:hypothetical protein [Paraliomyxa miuraensis]|uniref:hypothetical protein n=1 Tax=Paraliomyxa miuraensis TaxID=376150 RepID=UPI0022576224|nr:hypothetical protein [Paraliomyxa miuraensis]MCX4242008.1 hypothetical protein [Paraliomyxa miuraensis]